MLEWKDSNLQAVTKVFCYNTRASPGASTNSATPQDAISFFLLPLYSYSVYFCSKQSVIPSIFAESGDPDAEAIIENVTNVAITAPKHTPIPNATYATKNFLTFDNVLSHIEMAPSAGLEPATRWLTATCSTN